MLCLPGDIEKAFVKIKNAVTQKKLGWDNIDSKVRKVLAAKYDYVIGNIQPINTANLVNDLNTDADKITSLVAKNVITILSNENKSVLAPKKENPGKILYIGIGLSGENIIAKKLKAEYKADFIPVDSKTTIRQKDIANWVKNYSAILVLVKNYS